MAKKVEEKVAAERKRLKALPDEKLFTAEYMQANREDRIDEILDDFRVDLEDMSDEELFFAQTHPVTVSWNDAREGCIKELLEEFEEQAEEEDAEDAKEQAAEIVKDELTQ